MTEASDRTESAPVRIAVPRERQAGERRVALVPATLRALLAAGLQVTVEAGAGGGRRPGPPAPPHTPCTARRRAPGDRRGRGGRGGRTRRRRLHRGGRHR